MHHEYGCKTHLSVLIYSQYSQTKQLLSFWQTRCPNLNLINSKSIFLIQYVLCTFHLTVTYRKQITSSESPACPEPKMLVLTSFLWTLLLKYLTFYWTNICLSKQTKINKMRTGKGYLFRACCITGESVTVSWFWQRLKGGTEVGKLYSGKNGRFQRCPGGRLVT